MKNFLLFLALGMGVCIGSGVSVRAEPSLVAQSRYFTVYADAPGDLSEAMLKLDSSYGLLPGSGPLADAESARPLFESTLDGLYEHVADILGIRVQDFKADIRIVGDQAALEALVKQKLGLDLTGSALYSSDTNTVYLNLADLNITLLAKQIARALICRFFIVAPPSRFQDILADYVAQSVRSSGGINP